jgi:hypothetical protein
MNIFLDSVKNFFIASFWILGSYFVGSEIITTFYNNETGDLSINISPGVYFFIWIVSFLLFIFTFRDFRIKNLFIYNPINIDDVRFWQFKINRDKSKRLAIVYFCIFYFMSTFYVKNINDNLIYLITIALSISLIEINYKMEKIEKIYLDLSPVDLYRQKSLDFNDWKKISKYPITYLLGFTILIFIVITLYL